VPLSDSETTQELVLAPTVSCNSSPRQLVGTHPRHTTGSAPLFDDTGYCGLIIVHSVLPWSKTRPRRTWWPRCNRLRIGSKRSACPSTPSASPRKSRSRTRRVRRPMDEPARVMEVAADLWGPSRITDQKLKVCVTLVQRPPFTTARNEEFAPCRMFSPKLSCGPLKMSW
jgi:hypothetical protein